MESSLRYNADILIRQARDMLRAANRTAEIGEIKTALNRAYYTVFYAMSAANALDGFSSSKHSGVIAHFNLSFIKTGKMPAEMSKIISETMNYREKADYNPEYDPDYEIMKTCLKKAEYFLDTTEKYINETEAENESVGE